MRIHADGCCEPNPGKGTWAFAVLENGCTSYHEKGFLGDGVTNNVAEYMAVIKALEYVERLGVVQPAIWTDSKLVVCQISGEWRCEKEHLTKLRDCARELVKSTGAVVGWIPRDQNEADEWTRIAYEEATGYYPKPRTKAAKQR